jgi:hypothetical protein
MLNRTERITRKQLEKARHCGELVDLSDQAERAGLSCRCEMSRALYRSLFWKYPSSGERDTVDLVELLGVLHKRIKSTSQRRKPYYFIRPPRPTWWMESRYFLKALVVYRGNAVQSVVVLGGLAQIDSLLSGSAPAVPASMLVRMMLLIQQLWPLCYPAERAIVRSLKVTTYELLRGSPLSAQIHHYLGQQQPSLVPSGFSSEEYREVTLRSFWQQLELTAAVAEKLGADIKLPVSGVLQLMANYVGFIPARQDGTPSGNKPPVH